MAELFLYLSARRNGEAERENEPDQRMIRRRFAHVGKPHFPERPLDAIDDAALTNGANAPEPRQLSDQRLALLLGRPANWSTS